MHSHVMCVLFTLFSFANTDDDVDIDDKSTVTSLTFLDEFERKCAALQ
jgi:hypothetical protein